MFRRVFYRHSGKFFFFWRENWWKIRNMGPETNAFQKILHLLDQLG